MSSGNRALSDIVVLIALICFPAYASGDTTYSLPDLEDKVSETERAFQAYNQAMSSAATEQDMDLTLALIEQFVHQYPGTEAADMALATVKILADTGKLNPDTAKMFYDEIEPIAHLGGAELHSIRDRWNQARESQDIGSLRSIATEMDTFSKKYPDTFSGFNASTYLPQILLDAGEKEEALRRYREMLDTYAVSDMGFAMDIGTLRGPLFSMINLTAELEGPDRALNFYGSIGENNKIPVSFNNEALMRGAKLAMSSQQYEKAISFLDKIMKQYSDNIPKPDMLITMAEAQYLAGNIDDAIDMYLSIVNTLDDPYRKNALEKLAGILNTFAGNAEYERVRERIEAALDSNTRGIFAGLMATKEKEIGRHTPLNAQVVSFTDPTLPDNTCLADNLHVMPHPDKLQESQIPADNTNRIRLGKFAIVLIGIGTIIAVVLVLAMLRSRHRRIYKDS